MDKPFFTVAICTYNRAKKINKAMDSLLRQSFTNFEVIVLDDGSLDNTEAVVKKHRINPKYYKLSHKGLGYARQKALEKAKAEWVAFLDDDDEFLPDHLSVRARTIKGDKKVDMLYGGVKIIGSKYVPDFDNPKKLISINSSKVFQGGTLVVNRKKALAAGGFKEVMDSQYPDNFLAVAKKYKFKIIKVNKQTYLYRHKKTSLTSKLAKKIGKILNNM